MNDHIMYIVSRTWGGVTTYWDGDGWDYDRSSAKLLTRTLAEEIYKEWQRHDHTINYRIHKVSLAEYL